MLNVNINKMCRVCMGEGSREIFNHQTVSNATDNISMRLLEKLRYVTLIKINENENLPTLLCDSCIIQLNVSYNFKRQAIDTNTKLHQYIIENDLIQTSKQEEQNNFTTTKTTTSSVSVLPSKIIEQPSSVHIKSEPIIDYEILSDATFDTNTEETDDCTSYGDNNYCTAQQLRNHLNSPADTTTKTFPTYSNSIYSPTIHQMVRLGDSNFLRTTTSDTEFIKNYIQSSTTSTLSTSSTTITDLNSLTIDPPMHQISPSGSDATTTTTSFVIANVKLPANKLIDNNNQKNVELLAEKKVVRRRGVKKGPYAVRRISGCYFNNSDQIELLSSNQDNSFYKLRNNKKKSKDKVINPLNKLSQKVKQEKKKFLHRKTSKLLQNTSDVSGKLKSVTNGQMKLRNFRQKIIKKIKKIDKNDVKRRNGKKQKSSEQVLKIRLSKKAL